VFSNANNITKAGYHVIFPDVIVTTDTALAFREAVLCRMRSNEDNELQEPSNGWEDVVDASVLKANGLRMVFAAKSSSNQKFYFPAMVVSSSDAADKVRIEAPSKATASYYREWVKRLSTRVLDEHIQETPHCLPTDTIRQHGNQNQGHHQGIGLGARSLEAYRNILPHILSALGKEYEGSQFTGIYKGINSVVLRSSSKKCANMVKGFHNSNNVYFVITKAGIAQRCFCRCLTTEGRKQGYCKDFTSDTIPLPDAITSALLARPPTDVLFVDDGGGDGSAQSNPTQMKASTPSSLSLLLNNSIYKSNKNKKRRY
jgi:hypothetical protein